MDIAFLLLVLTGLWLVLRARYQAQRVAFLGRHLAGLQVEKHMETLTQGYLRAIREQDVVRQSQIWETFEGSERGVAGQVERLAEAIAKESDAMTRMGRWALCVPYIERFAAPLTLDFKRLLQLHALGIRQVVDNQQGLGAKERAYQLSAELFLLQHSCHWYCKSRTIADARLVARHQVNHAKVLASVFAQTRAQYQQWFKA
ncbi:hypothetical protein E9531_01815 [Lampropedia puyangensis]|uniref:Uncharacterized protein n=1 Tax=Lampropedia puyangensis TaxID=1330072 RepID=A0A4S8FFF5_9BURK|nr:hypothetical protein [Lampropedia puyangensis]THU05304.1 hypothetical protein E9531_01815 [Lampropedia puyangensis]